MGIRFKGLLLALLLVSAPAFAANVDGDWSGPIGSPNGPVQMNHTFKADGATLTTDFQGEPVNITVKKVAAK